MSQQSEPRENGSFPASTELCDTLFELSPDALFLADSQPYFLKANHKLCDMLGYTGDELLALSLGEIISGSDIRVILDSPKSMLKGEARSGHCYLRRNNGELLAAEFRIQRLISGDLLGQLRNIEGQRRIEEQFRESEERFRLLAESSLTGIYLIQDGRFSYINKAFADMFGYEVEEVLSELKMADLVYPEDRPLVIENIRRRVKGEEVSVRYVFRGLRKDGSTIFVEVHGRSIYYKGKIGVIGSLINITEGKKAEAALKASEERYRVLYNENPSMFFTLDADGIILSVNDFGANRIGYSKDQLQGRSLLSLLHDDDKEVVSRSLKSCLHSPGQVFHWQYRKIAKDGRLMWVEEFARSVDRPDGNANILVVSQDITERVQLEESLKVSQFIFDQASISIFVLNDDNQIVDVNSHACQSLGYTKQELCSLSMFDVDSSISRKRFSQITRLLRPTKSTSFETIHQRKNGETFLVQLFVSTLRYNNTEYRVYFVQDISEREQARIEQEKLKAQLAQVQKLEAIGRLAGGVAHDLNNLLTPILGYTDLLSFEKSISDSAREKLAQINKAASGARDLVKQLLALSRKQILAYQPLNLNTVVDGFGELIRRTIREDIEIKTFKSIDMKPVLADRGQIEQVLMNMVVNASDAMTSGGKLSIETKMTELDETYTLTHPDVTPGVYAMLAISDTGKGMDKETVSKIFEPFFSTKGEKGTGLGLATVYGIIKQHKGSIWLYSEPGRGTTFRIYLPVAEKLPGAAAKSVKSHSKSHGTETILLVEDNEAVRATAHDILKEHGYHVILAADGKTAIESAAAGVSIDMILTDVIMPDMNGRELFSIISELFPSVKVLYMSGYTDNIIVHHGVLDDGIQFIQKPFSSSAILQKVRAVLDSSP